MNFRPTKLKLIIALIIGLALGISVFYLIMNVYYPLYSQCPLEAGTYCGNSINSWFWVGIKFAFSSFIFGSFIPYFIWSLFQKKINGERSSVWAYLGVVAVFILILSILFIISVVGVIKG